MKRLNRLTLVLTAALQAGLAFNAPAFEFAPVPDNYPTEEKTDTFSETPYESDYATRRSDYLQLNAQSRGNGAFSEAVKMYTVMVPHEDAMRHAPQ